MKERPLSGGLLFFVWLGIVSCSSSDPNQEPSRFLGPVMGTTWSAVIADKITDSKQTQDAIQEELDKVDRLMSNWKDESDVNRFNRQKEGERLIVSSETLYVMEASKQVYTQTEGRFDPTLGPLIELWGFSRKEKLAFPQEEEIQAAIKKMGMDHIEWDKYSMWKTKPDVSLNLSAIAKGYGVDAAYERLVQMGFQHFLVEVGGEVRVRGKKNLDTAWRIGIETPNYSSGISRDIFAIAQLEEVAMATSGDYRNFFEFEGKNYSHIIDPGSGYPVESPIASATVIAPNCTLADALATAFMILPPEKSLAICSQQPGLYCLIIERETGKTYYSEGMKSFIVAE